MTQIRYRALFETKNFFYDLSYIGVILIKITKSHKVLCEKVYLEFFFTMLDKKVLQESYKSVRTKHHSQK